MIRGVLFGRLHLLLTRTLLGAYLAAEMSIGLVSGCVCLLLTHRAQSRIQRTS